MATPAQEAINKKAASLICEMEQRWSPLDLERLLFYLKKCRNTGPWGMAIMEILSHEVPDASKVNHLIDSLSKQAADDFVTLTEIVGSQATVLLLRYYDKKTPHNYGQNEPPTNKMDL